MIYLCFQVPGCVFKFSFVRLFAHRKQKKSYLTNKSPVSRSTENILLFKLRTLTTSTKLRRAY